MRREQESNPLTPKDASDFKSGPLPFWHLAIKSSGFPYHSMLPQPICSLSPQSLFSFRVARFNRYCLDKLLWSGLSLYHIETLARLRLFRINSSNVNFSKIRNYSFSTQISTQAFLSDTSEWNVKVFNVFPSYLPFSLYTIMTYSLPLLPSLLQRVYPPDISHFRSVLSLHIIDQC